MNNPMNTELYNKIFQRLDELGTNGIKVIHKKPELFENQWDSSKPLKDQTDEFGEKLYSLIK